MLETILPHQEEGDRRALLLDIQHLTLLHHPFLTISELTQTVRRVVMMKRNKANEIRIYYS